MEDAGLLNINSPIDLFALHLTFIPRINFALREFLEGSNHHRVRTANYWSPNPSIRPYFLGHRHA